MAGIQCSELRLHDLTSAAGPIVNAPDIDRVGGR